MTKRFRNAVLATTAAAAIAVPVMPASPAVAQDYDCQIAIIGPSHIPQEVLDCVYYILISAIDWPPR
ncbi:MAG: hypothetical protein M3323_11660 [Actinomycetota bacterium]|nr:hypothetical protein [Actinomycetota bacterium]